MVINSAIIGKTGAVYAENLEQFWEGLFEANFRFDFRFNFLELF